MGGSVVGAASSIAKMASVVFILPFDGRLLETVYNSRRMHDGMRDLSGSLAAKKISNILCKIVTPNTILLLLFASFLK